MTIELTLQSKRYLDIRAALNFLIESDCHHSGHNVSSTKPRRKKSLVWTVLRSPHVNKTAREQLKQSVHSERILLFTGTPSKFILFYKKTLRYLFPTVEVSFTSCDKTSKLCPSIVSVKNRTLSLKHLDILGENLFKSNA